MRGKAMSPDPSIAVLAGDFSNGLENGTLKGLAIADYHIKSGVGVLAYNTVAPEYRGEGLGRILLDARVELLKEMAQAYGRELKAVFFEINDPRKISSGQDSIDPAKRMSIYTKMGAFPVPIDYVQPPLAGGGQKCRNLLLMALPLPGKGMPDPETIAEFLDGIYEATIGPGYESDPDLQAMKEQLRSPDFGSTPSLLMPPRNDQGPGACPR
jgi:GNAT superfamily N-acetyltransferase